MLATAFARSRTPRRPPSSWSSALASLRSEVSNPTYPGQRTWGEFPDVRLDGPLTDEQQMCPARSSVGAGESSSTMKFYDSPHRSLQQYCRKTQQPLWHLSPSDGHQIHRPLLV